MKRSFIRRLAVIAFGGVGLAAPIALLPLPAAAAPTAALGDGQVVVGQVSATKQGQGVSASQTINCKLSIDTPHKSNYNSSAWNVHLKWECTDNVATLSVTPEIYKNGYLVGVGNPPTKSIRNRRHVKNNAAAPCYVWQAQAHWFGAGTGHVVFPPGYTPQSDTLYVRSDEVLQGFRCEPPPVYGQR